MTTKLPQIAIIGAGLSGLTLSLALKQKGIATIIYEKASSPPNHNYGILLYPSTYRPLLKILQLSEDGFQQEVGIDPRLKQTGSPAHITGTRKNHGAFHCHRFRLEALLRKNLSISWGKDLRRVTRWEQGETNVMEFGDRGHRIQAACIVGCDGVHSKVRNYGQSAAHKPTVLPYVVFEGWRNFTIRKYNQTVRPYMGDEHTLRARIGSVSMKLSIQNVNWALRTVRIGYVYSRPARGSEAEDTLYRPNRPPEDAKKILEEFYAELDELGNTFKSIMELGPRMDEILTDLVKSPAGTLREEMGTRSIMPLLSQIFDAENVRADQGKNHWLMRVIEPDIEEAKRLAAKGVVLIGDSVHATPILGGDGANDAINDGLDLANWIAQQGLDGLESFVEMKEDLWAETVEDSKRRIEEMHTRKNEEVDLMSEEEEDLASASAMTGARGKGTTGTKL